MDLRAWNASSLLVRPELALAVTSSLYQTWVTKCLGELKRILGWLLHENSVDTYIYLITVYNIYIYIMYIYIYRWLTSMVSPIKKSRLGWRDSFQQLMKQTGTFPINQIPKSMTFHDFSCLHECRSCSWLFLGFSRHHRERGTGTSSAAPSAAVAALPVAGLLAAAGRRALVVKRLQHGRDGIFWVDQWWFLELWDPESSP